MPVQDPNLYGQRPIKKQRTALALSASGLDFSAQLTSVIAESAASKSSGPRRPKPIDTSIKKTIKTEEVSDSKRLNLKKILQTREENQQLERSRQRLEEKAKLYNAFKRGDTVDSGNFGDSLIDFDRKWAEEQERKGSGSRTDSDSSFEASDDDEMVEYTDEFGRTRQITKAEKRKIDHQAMCAMISDQALGEMSARPARPDNVIYGDYIQTEAFKPTDEKLMEELAKKRDRSLTPPPATHYDGNWEIRDKGVGFYKFSKDEQKRAEEMESLKNARKETEEKRKLIDAKKEERKRQLEERKQEIERRKAAKRADKFLSTL